MEDGIGRAWVDAVVGNPPFSGKNGIAEHGGTTYSGWLTSSFVPSHGNSDLSAYFFRRAAWMLGEHGAMGLIATNTIGQGDTRTTGLQALTNGGATIYDAKQDMKWPVKGANVSVSIVHIAKGVADHAGLPRFLDGLPVESINSQLRPSLERVNPSRLEANRGLGFRGAIVLGMGFVLSKEQSEDLKKRDSRNSSRIFPYLGGQELNTSPTQACERHVINFDDMDLIEASKWPLLLEILREKVKPERDLVKDSAWKKYWWRYARRAEALYAAILPLSRCLACSNVSKHLAFSFRPTDVVFANTLAVFALPEYSHFGLLQSRVHELWARLHGSTLEDRLRYSPTDCFETFPFPDEHTLGANGRLEAIAERLYTNRAAYMVATDQGLTKTYNALTDPTNLDAEIEHLRRLHEQLDRAVLDAYGQTHIEVPPYTGATPEQLERFQDQVLDFLFARNALLAKREAAAQARAKS